ncbi:hypothetical protein [Actinoplanes aureus]|uniref:Secreted protein n=1 Tax=Actinoplanes aureus TaxID=2792083 RepID=A0A931FZT9_9ACTN|nr:hypothetical protein [Actinoplanes aureus]MBG0566023.1 hypothetical protein [Actinoplanes aureus]
MSALIEQLPVLLGVLVGTGGTILATGIADRSRWQRQQAVRWDERRLQAYIEFANAVKEVHTYALRVADLNALRQGVDREHALARIEEADIRRTKTWESVLLLGDAASVTAGREWRAAVTDIARYARGLTPAEFDLAAAIDHANETRDRFYQAARASLGIRGVAVPQSDWLAGRFELPSAPG